MKIGDDDFRLLDVWQHVAGNEFTLLEIALGVVRLENAKAIFDGNAWGHDEKTACEAFAAGVAHGVDGVPGDQHRHDRGFAGASG